MFAKSKIFVGRIILVIICITPLVFWLLLEPLGRRFSDLNSTLTSLGQIFALLGFSLFAIVIMLAARLKFVEDYFHGLNRVYINHHFLGGVAFILLLFHPLWLTAKYAVASSYSAALFLLPDLHNPAKTLGGTALGLMLVLLIITFYLSLKYHVWKLSHKFLALAFTIGFTHMLLIPSDVSRHPGLKIYMVILAAGAFFSILYRVLFSRGLIKKYHYSIVAINKLNRGVIEIVMKPAANERLEFQPGQFAFFSFIAPGLSREYHPFSFTSSPAEELLKIIVKALGDFTVTLSDKLKVGSPVFIEGPFGRFVSHGQKQIWLAGGIGVTPFISMAQNIPTTTEVDFFYSAISETDLLWREELISLSSAQKNFHFFPHFSSTAGHLTAEMIKSKSQNFIAKEIFICGPPPMMRSLKKQFINLGVSSHNIHTEEFSL
ncbi:MAG TPA: ferric reductase-like transmembrane domain-containing protein [Patescibacteria group bacterium]|nr:ferric reductase-like transmembrane domain-containing protein [Patescibacteria group bacterium]